MPSETKSDVQGHNDIIFEKLGQLGRYHALLIPVVWWGHICAIVNETYMVFAGADVDLACPNATDYSIDDCNVTSQFYGIVEQWRLVDLDDGDRKLAFAAPLCASMQLAGTLLGTFTGGYASDTIGRWKTFLASATARTIVGVISSFMPNWYSFLIFRVFVGFANGAYFSVGYIYMMEVVSQNYRLLIQALGDAIMSVGFCWSALLAYATGSWKWDGIIGNLVIIPALLGFLFLEESPRWLVQKGKVDQADKVARKIAKWNRIDVPGFKDPTVFEKKSTRAQPPLKTFLKATFAKHMSMLFLSFFVTGLVGYGIIFNTGNLSGDIFLNFAVLGMVNLIPLIILIFCEKVWNGVRRRWTHQISLVGVAVCFLVIVIVYLVHREDDLAKLLSTASFIGSMFSVPLWTVCALYSAELFPTLVRTLANGLGNTGARLGGILAPLVVEYLIKFWKPIPFIIFGGLALVNVVGAWFFLPETKGVLLPDDADESNETPYEPLE